MKELHTFFMLTNPLPLLTFVDSTYGTAANFGEEVFGNLPKLYHDLTNETLKIVNFYDPNDILNFSLEDVPASVQPHLDVRTIKLNVGQGYSINKKQLYKLLKKLDRKLLTRTERKMLKSYVHPNLDGLIEEIFTSYQNGEPRNRHKDYKRLRRIARRHQFLLPHFFKNN